MFSISKEGKYSYQISWLLAACALPAGLSIFSSLGGGVGDLLSSTVSRLVLNYNNFLTYIFSIISKLLDFDILIYKNELTFATLISLPYLIRFKKVEFGGIYDDKYIFLSLLNLCAIILIMEAFPVNSDKVWYGATSTFLISAYFIYRGVRSLKDDPDYRRKLKFSIIFGFSLVAVASVVYPLLKTGLPSAMNFFVMFFAGFAYFLGMLARIDGSYPFLYSVIFYFVLYAFNYILLNISPTVDRFLTSIGV